jgi:hypothetical protein
MRSLSMVSFAFDLPGSDAGRDGARLTKATAKTTTKTV